VTLNAQEFEKRSEDFFVATYLTSVGVIQSISLGVLAAKVYTVPFSLQFIAQALASFFAIVIVANEYSWWVLLIRRTPGVFDYLIPYSLGAAELGVMAKVDNTEGIWFLTAGILAIVGVGSLAHNRRYATEELFVECPWLHLRVRRNLLKGTVLVACAAVVMFGSWLSYEHIGHYPKVVIFCVLYVVQVAILIMTTVFMKRVRERFESE